MTQIPYQRPLLFAWLLLATLACGQPLAAQAQTVSPLPDCTAPEAITPAHLYGQWQLTLGAPENPASKGQLVFERHPEFAGSVRGSLEREMAGKPQKALVAGDVTDQGFQLEESADGVTIDAVWTGEVEPTRCGREIRGWRSVAEGRTTQEPLSDLPFVLKKTMGWQ
jgi:hypothetical protein